MKSPFSASRRGFLKQSLQVGAAVLATGQSPAVLQAAWQAPTKIPNSQVSLMAGNDPADNVFRALRVFAPEIRRVIGNRRVVIKPNNVCVDVPLCATPVECLEGILEFLKSIAIKEATIAESPANGPTMSGFENYGYLRLARQYRIQFLDLDQQESDRVYVFDEKDFQPHPVRMSKLLLDSRNFLISAAKLKTHDRVIATLSLKNIVFGAPLKDPGFTWGKDSKPGARTDKHIPHGSGIRAINYNLFALVERLHPHLSVIDGYRGMEGNGPNWGTPVEHRVALASLDWLAADRLGIELMGIDFSRVGYLNYCAKAGMGEANLESIEILGEPLARHIRKYKLADNYAKQLAWQNG